MDTFAEGTSYEDYMGRWSRPMALEFLRWLDAPQDARWLDVGCGTGALLATIDAVAEPSHLAGIDPSADFISTARQALGDAADLRVGDAQSLPYGDDEFDATVSGLALNFVPDPGAALRQMRRVTRNGGVVAAYVWDYAAGMEMIRTFWDAALDLDPAITHLDEATRFPLCHPDRLTGVFTASGLNDVESTALDIATVFADFNDYWRPFLGAQGPAPTYVASLGEEDRDRLRDRIRSALPMSADGRIELTARAWAVRGVA